MSAPVTTERKANVEELAKAAKAASRKLATRQLRAEERRARGGGESAGTDTRPRFSPQMLKTCARPRRW